MLQGRYRDVVTDAGGRCGRPAPWRSNLVVDGAFNLLAALLKRERGMDGILYWAVGEGEPGWDRNPPSTEPRTTRLVSEVLRLEVPPDAITYVDGRGAESARPEPVLEIRLAFEWPDRGVTLREFGVFGGDASGRPDTGVMVNHVIHPRIELAPGQRLSRQLRLFFGRPAERRWAEIGPHPLGDFPAQVVDGVGDRFGAALEAAGISTLEALSRSDPAVEVRGVPRVRLVELRSKARLALRTAAEIHPPPALGERTVSELLRRPPAAVAMETGVPEGEVARLREQLATLELALDHGVLGRQPVGALGAPSDRVRDDRR